MNQAELRSILDYDPESGIFRWKTSWYRRKAGAVAGYKNKLGYVAISIGNVPRLAHRLAWVWFHGCEPACQIDHINGDRSDNRISNLRDVSRSVNQQNRRKATAGSKTGVQGVIRRGNSWRATIRNEGRQVDLGSHPCPLIAHVAYLNAKREMHDGCTI